MDTKQRSYVLIRLLIYVVIRPACREARLIMAEIVH